MSRIYGFLGGTTTTLAIAYLTASEIRSNSQKICNYLQESKKVLDNCGQRKAPGPRTIEYESRDDIIETMKDLWNHEIARGVTWFYSLGEK